MTPTVMTRSIERERKSLPRGKEKDREKISRSLRSELLFRLRTNQTIEPCLARLHLSANFAAAKCAGVNVDVPELVAHILDLRRDALAAILAVHKRHIAQDCSRRRSSRNSIQPISNARIESTRR